MRDGVSRNEQTDTFKTRNEAVRATGNYFDEVSREAVSVKCISDAALEVGTSGKFFIALSASKQRHRGTTYQRVYDGSPLSAVHGGPESRKPAIRGTGCCVRAARVP